MDERTLLTEELYRFKYPGGLGKRPIKVLLDECGREVDVLLTAQRRYAEQDEALERGL